MGPLDALWHLANLFGPALGLALLAPALAKAIYRRELASVRFADLALAVGSACALVSLAALLLLGRDGRMLTYAALVVAAALVLWWRGGLYRR